MFDFVDDMAINTLLTRSSHEHILLANSLTALFPNISSSVRVLVNALSRGNKLLIFGNGGSASDAQHIAAELVGRFVKDRVALPAIALTTDTSILTADSNDYGYENVFSRQIEALSKPGDVVIGISTSGNSPNVVKALEVARILNCHTIGLSGRDGGEIKEIADINIIVPSSDTARIQEMHILIGHLLCEALDHSISSCEHSSSPMESAVR
jgi:D-sedoheptulose 7-phosphate isomerase